MQQWQHMTWRGPIPGPVGPVLCDGPDRDFYAGKDFAVALTAAGSAGWELVSAVPEGREYRLFFRRPVRSA